MSAITGNYKPAVSLYVHFATSMIYRPSSRKEVAYYARIVRARSGNHEAVQFLAYCSWLGVLPPNMSRYANAYVIV